jgi:BolA protein
MTAPDPGETAVVESETRVQAIEDALEHGLGAVHVEIVDHSLRHATHAGAARGGGHFEVLVVSGRFEGLARLARQRLVYEALGDLMDNEIHALTMTTLTPPEWRACRAAD